MDRDVLARLHQLETHDRRMKRAGAAAVGLLTIAMFAAMVFQEDSEVVTGYYENGVPSFRARVRDNKYEGTYTEWSRRGVKTMEGEYRARIKHGVWTEWNGIEQTRARERSQGQYRGGDKSGIWSTWSEETGLKTSEGEWDGRAMVGHWTFWRADGSIDEDRSGRYESGRKVK